MSYILDALRRADAERQHGQVPGLNAQAGVPPAGAAPSHGSGPLWLGVGALVALLALAAWWWTRPDVPVLAVPSSAPVLASPDPLPQPAVTAMPVPPPAVPGPAAAALPVVVSAAPVALPPRADFPAAAAVPQPQASAVPLASLSAAQRRDLPVLAVGGSVWSANAGSRFVIFNGQLVHEGELAAPGVVVQSIGPRSAVLRWRDLRIEVPF